MDLVSRLQSIRQEEQRLNWEGTFAEYFDLVVKHPQAARLSHARIYDMIMSAGVDQAVRGAKSYQFFAEEIYGLEETLHQLVEYFHSAAKRLEVRKRILLFMGPVGGGKSTIVSMLKRGLERYTRSDEGAIYAIKGCPMHEEPLHLIPESLRPEIEKEYGLYIEGDLCPVCRQTLRDDYAGVAEHMPIQRIAFSEKHRTGIGTFSPSDPKSQDITELTGSIDLSRIGEYGVESDPRAYRFDGELNISNRGLMEFIEMLKCLRGDTLVYTGQGIRRLESLAGADHPTGQSRPVDVTLATAAGVEAAAHIYRSGPRKTRRIASQRGYALEGGNEHRVLVVNDDGVEVWKRLDALQTGDWLVMQKGQQLWGDGVAINWRPARGRLAGLTIPQSVTPELARWLGYLVAEGDTRPDGTIRFTNSEAELRSDFAQLTHRLFGIVAREYPTTVQLNSVALLDLLTWLGFRTGSDQKSIPWSILQAPRECVLEFLTGYFAGDGTVNLHGRLSWTTASPLLAEQVQVTLLNLGVVARRIRTRARARASAAYADYWTVTASGTDADRLAAQMRLMPLRKQATYDQRSAAQARVDRADLLPNTATYWAQISDALQEVAKARAQVAVGGPGYRERTGARQILGEDYSALHALRTGTNTCTRETASKLLGKLEGWVDPPAGLARLLNASQFYDRVVSIEEAEAECWDLNVPGSNTYVANGIVSHNCDEKFLYGLLTLSQEQNIKTGRFSMIYADECIVSHTNEAEYSAFAGNRRSEALQDRIILIRVPYNLRVSDEVKIYEKLIGQSNLKDVHIAPNALRVASVFAVLSRLEEPKKAGMSLMKKLKLYDGESVDEFTQKDVKELRDETAREGMDGISPRYVINRLSTALVKDGTTCINPIDTLRALRDGLEQHTAVKREDRERLFNFIAEARREYDELAKKEVQKAFVYSFEDSARTLFNNYLDNVEAYCNKQKIKDPLTEEEVEADEKLMRAVEEQIGVSEVAKKTFREEILIRISSLARRGQTFDYRSHERLREAIEKKLFVDLRDVVKITTSTKTPDEEQLRRINEVVDRLIKEQGYCAVCANELLKYVGTMLNR